jgi:predicted MFS family arabinose efflux permease
MENSGSLRAVSSALCATLVGIGVARFGYSPLIPPLIAQHWFTPAQAAYLGAGNLAGYLFGALSARKMASRVSPGLVIRAAMLLVSASFLACDEARPFAWFLCWRFLSGLAGGVIMVLAAPLVLPQVPAQRRGLAGGLVFTGVGIGVVLSATVIPWLLHFGLGFTWMMLGGLCLGLTLIAWGGWPKANPVTQSPASATTRWIPAAPGLAALLLVYALDAVGVVPHMIFLVDYVARGLGHGIATGALLWIVFGLGAVTGPVSFGHLGDRIGFRRMLRLTLAIQAGALLLASWSTNLWALGLSGFIIGAFTPGIAPVVLGRIRDLIPGDVMAQQAAWRWTTIAFALGQAAGAYGDSAIFAEAGYRVVFLSGFMALTLALLIDLAGGRHRNSSATGPS